MKDDDWQTIDRDQRKFIFTWVGMNEGEREHFLRQLLAAIQVLQHLGVLDSAEGEAPAQSA
jgi:predicted Fe-S protein YdhL (DUF1289 family)